MLIEVQRIEVQKNNGIALFEESMFETNKLFLMPYVGINEIKKKDDLKL